MNRRELLPILAAAAQHQHHKPAQVSTAAYQRQTFNDEQNQVLEALAEVILPADASSPGAKEAKVSQYFDLVATHVPAVKKAFEEGLEDFKTLAEAQLGTPLAQLSRAQLTSLLEIASVHEGNPTNGAEAFFELLKFHTVEGYRLSHIGQTQWLGYKPHSPGLYPDLTIE